MKLLPVIIAAVIGVVVLAATVPIITEHAENDSETWDVFIVAGQSNTYASIAVDASSAFPVPESGTGYYFGTETAPTYHSMDLTTCAVHDLDSDGSAAIGGVYAPFAAEYYAQTGHKAYLIDVGLSGQTLYTFLPGNANWAYVCDVIDAGVKAIPQGQDWTCKGYIWIQGEGDAGTPIATYEARMLQLSAAYASGEMGVKAPVGYICKVRDSVSHNASAAQIYLADNFDQFVMATELADTFSVASGTMYTDDLHYSQAGCNALGASMGHTIGALNVPSHTEANLIKTIPLILVIAVFLCIAGGVVALRSRD